MFSFVGALQNGIADIKNHAFFSSQNIDFEKLLDQQIEMPYQPGSVICYLLSVYIYEISCCSLCVLFYALIMIAAFQFEWKNEPSSQGDQIDFEFEESVLVNDDYSGYFEDISKDDE